MHGVFLSALILLAGAPASGAPADAPPPMSLYQDLTPGPYQVRIKGMLTWACAMMLKRELSLSPKLMKADADFEKETVVFTVKTNARLTMKELRGILARAARKMKITRYDIADIRYMPSSR